MNNLGKNQCRIIDSANNTLPYFKNPCYSLQVPLRESKSESFSFAYYNPYTNTIPTLEPNSKLTDSGDLNPNDSQKVQTNFSKDQNEIQNFFKSVSDRTENLCDLPVISSPDSAICMDFSSSCISISEKSNVIFSCLRAKIESKIELSSFSKIPWNINDFGFSPLCRISLKKISCKLSLHLTEEDHLMEVDEPKAIEKMIVETENRERIENPSVDFLNVNTFRSQSLFVNSKKKVVTPKRYIKWRKSKSSVTITRISKTRKSKYKFQSQTNINKRRNRFLSKSSSCCSSLVPRRSKKLSNSLKLSNSFFAKICNVVLPSTFKQYMQVSPTHQTPEKNIHRQKYTPLPSPLPVPAKIARLSNPEIKSTSTFTPDRKIACQNSSTSLKLRSAKADRSRKEDKPFIVVFFKLFIYLFFKLSYFFMF